MIKLSQATLARAINRAKSLHPTVRFIAERHFTVVSPVSGNQYEVKFDVIDREKFGSCTCKAGQRGTACYHIASAASVNIGVQSMRLQTGA
jgi:hypothetical protein